MFNTRPRACEPRTVPQSWVSSIGDDERLTISDLSVNVQAERDNQATRPPLPPLPKGGNDARLRLENKASMRANPLLTIFHSSSYFIPLRTNSAGDLHMSRLKPELQLSKPQNPADLGGAGPTGGHGVAGALPLRHHAGLHRQILELAGVAAR